MEIRVKPTIKINSNYITENVFFDRLEAMKSGSYLYESDSSEILIDTVYLGKKSKGKGYKVREVIYLFKKYPRS